MKKSLVIFALAASLTVAGCSSQLKHAQPGTLRLSHDVYFTLNDSSDAQQAKIVADCYQYLSTQPGIVYFSAGELVESHKRDVNVTDFDVALHITFASKAHHDAYQDAPDHHKFIELNKDNWKSVRVFDSYIK